MARQWTFGRRIALGFAVAVALTVSIGMVAIFALRSVTASKDEVMRVEARLLVQAQGLRAFSERKSSAGRAFLLGRDDRFMSQILDARRGFSAILEQLERNVPTEEGAHLVGLIERAEAAHQQTMGQVIALRRTEASLDAVERAFEDQVIPRRDELDTQIGAFVSRMESRLEEARQASN
ncbi:MAG TPA: CHASE3 domain-containing protein, partial [Kofleriaceae bacterium]|nr:CHASE3 domain-containing protein [Kofleriaceae bacterium]